MEEKGMTVNIAVCDDSIELLNELKKIIVKTFIDNKVSIKLQLYNTGEKFLEAFKEETFDAVFLDVYLPGMNGFQIAEKMNRIRSNTHIIFITSNTELVYECFSYKPFYFIRKDMYEREILRVVPKLIKEMNQNKLLSFDLHQERVSVLLKDILYVKSDGHSVLLCTHGYAYVYKSTISSMEESLREYDFIRIHRKYLVNLRYMHRINVALDEVILSNGIHLEMSRYYKKEVIRLHKEYLRQVN
jgi:DNA-binding LytR/AlgR family response regulator